MLVIAPSPWSFRKFKLDWVALWKVYLCQKYCCTLLLCAKDNFSAAISCLLISRTFLANNVLTIYRGEAIPYTTDYMNNAIWKRTSYIQTYLVNVQYFISVTTCHLCTYQCKSREGGVRARGGDLMPVTIPLSGFWSCEATPGSGHLTLTDRSLVSIQKQLPGGRFSNVPVTLRARNQIFKSKYKE